MKTQKRQLIDSSQLKQLQINILDYVDAFCEKHNIKYSLACGTLLGAVRHKGYIPWDDDIDIQMLRDDYERFINIWTKEYHAEYDLICPTITPNCTIPYAKVSLNTTEVIEFGKKCMWGVNIDIFPIDRVLNQQDFQFRHRIVLDLYEVIALKELSYQSWWHLRFNFKVFANNISNRLTIGAYAKHIDMIARSYNDSDADRLFEMIAGRLYKRTFSAKCFQSTVSVNFEGKMYPALIGYEEYLTACYSKNYMELPPIEKRISHHQLLAYFK